MDSVVAIYPLREWRYKKATFVWDVALETEKIPISNRKGCVCLTVTIIEEYIDFRSLISNLPLEPGREKHASEPQEMEMDMFEHT